LALHGKVDTMKEPTSAALDGVHAHQAQARSRILRRPEVEQRTGLSRSAIYAEMSKGRFPPAVQLTAKAVGWREGDVDGWIASREVAAAGVAA
jgi:prophage regulatory protein